MNQHSHDFVSICCVIKMKQNGFKIFSKNYKELLGM